MFIGGGQFGSRAFRYYTHFYKSSENIAKIIYKAVDLGITGIQVLPHSPIFRALRTVEKTLGTRLAVVATLGPNDPLADIKSFSEFNTVAMLLHGEITDRRRQRAIEELLNRIRATNCLAGLATHRPMSTLNWLLKTGLDVDLIMLPFNQLGMFMDASPQKVAEAIGRLNKPVIGKKVLAAGYLPPRDALRYVAQFGCIKAVALGIASEQEAEETFTIAAEVFSREKGNV